MIGTGILAMPIAYKNGGLWVSHGCYGYNKCGNIGQANFVCVLRLLVSISKSWCDPWYCSK